MHTYRSRLIATIALALGALVSVQAHAQTSILFLDSQPGDYIGGGVQHTVTPETGSFTASRNFDNGVTIQVNTGGGGWSLAFAAPGDAALVAGTYDNATRWPFQSPTNPGLSVSGMGRGCNTLTGNFRRFAPLRRIARPFGGRKHSAERRSHGTRCHPYRESSAS